MPCENKIHSILGFKMRFKVREVHHGYLGIILMVLSLLMPLWAAMPTFILGLYLLIDDCYQHARQVKEFNPCYHSPVHRFIYDYLKLYDRAWFRALNKFADFLFKNPLLVAIFIALIVVVYLTVR